VPTWANAARTLPAQTQLVISNSGAFRYAAWRGPGTRPGQDPVTALADRSIRAPDWTVVPCFCASWGLTAAATRALRPEVAPYPPAHITDRSPVPVVTRPGRRLRRQAASAARLRWTQPPPPTNATSVPRRPVPHFRDPGPVVVPAAFLRGGGSHPREQRSEEKFTWSACGCRAGVGVDRRPRSIP